MNKIVLRNLLSLALFFVTALSGSGWAPSSSLPILPEDIPYEAIQFAEKELKPLEYNYLPDGWKEIDLAGMWKLKKLPDTQMNPEEDEGTKQGYYKIDYDDTLWENFPVPWSWDIPPGTWDWRTGMKNRFNGVGWYRKEISIPEGYKDKRVILRFDAVDWKARVWFNNTYLGQNIDHILPFEFDITDYITEKKNIITVRVFNAGAFHLGQHSQEQYAPQGGIYQPVKLIIRPKIYAERILITPRLESSSIEADCWLNSTLKDNSMMELEGIVSAVRPEPKPRVIKSSLGKFTLKPGKNKINFQIELNNPVYWTPENPYLYSLEIIESEKTATMKHGPPLPWKRAFFQQWRDALCRVRRTFAISPIDSKTGEILGKERFGFRSFEAKGKYFYLNGKRTYLTSKTMWRKEFPPAGVAMLDLMTYNRNNFLRKWLLALKKANFNIIRTHTSVFPENFYNLCDEVGIMVYDEWYGNTLNKELLNFDEYKTNVTGWVYYNYNHPSVVMRNFGNEIYEHLFVKAYKESPIMSFNKYYELVKELDKSRPVTDSSGRENQPIPNQKIDFYDSHNYVGSVKGCWTETAAQLDGLVKDAHRYAVKPYINFETAGFVWNWPWGSGLHCREEIQNIFNQDPVDKKTYIKWAEFSGVSHDGLRMWFSHGGIRNFPDEKDRDKTRGLYFKRFIEEQRKVEDLVGLQPFDGGNRQMVDIAFKKEGPPYLKRIKGYEQIRDRFLSEEVVFVKTHTYYGQQKALNHILVMAGLFDQNLFSGGKLEMPLLIINDTPVTFPNSRARVIIYDGKENKINDEIENITLAGNSRQTIKYAWQIPETLKTGFYQIQLYLHDKDGKIISNNNCEFFVLNKDVPIKQLKCAEKIALYTSVGETFKGLGLPTVQTVLDNLKINYTLIREFDHLSEYKILIVDSNSLDKSIVEAGDKIREWIEAGGRLLCLDQSNRIYIPWVRELQITGGEDVFVELVEPNHPIFKGLEQKNFDLWNGVQGLIYKNMISPLNMNVIGSGSGGAHVENTKAIRSVIVDVKAGKGQTVISTLDAISRYGKDSVATMYIQNLLKYILEPADLKYAYDIQGEKGRNIKVDPARCVSIDLSAYANQDFTSSDGTKGWIDDGPGDLAGMPLGEQNFSGVPFMIIDPGKNNGTSCIILKGEHRPDFPAKINGIKINKKLDSLYFLHTGMYWSKLDKDVLLKYIIHYQDKTKAEIKMINREDIADWYKPKDLPNGIIAWTYNNLAVYLSAWKNPYPEKEIASLDIVSEEKIIPAIIAITGEKVFESALPFQ